MRSKSVKHSDHKKPRSIKSARTDKRVFSNTADRTDGINTGSRVMRGGIRL